jgi:hypothetical protein
MARAVPGMEMERPAQILRGTIEKIRSEIHYKSLQESAFGILPSGRLHGYQGSASRFSKRK